MWYSFSRDRKQATPTEESSEQGSIWVAIAKVVGGLTLLIVSCDIFVDNAVAIAKSLGASDAFISLTLIACGTSLPELAASIAAAVKQNTEMALGNIIGSNIFNITLILGLSSQVTPLTSSGITLIDYTVMIIAAVITLVMGLRGGINRLSGAVLVTGFVLYNWYLISSQIAL
jgi:cation:H+ antiporter